MRTKLQLNHRSKYKLQQIIVSWPIQKKVTNTFEKNKTLKKKFQQLLYGKVYYKINFIKMNHTYFLLDVLYLITYFYIILPLNVITFTTFLSILPIQHCSLGEITKLDKNNNRKLPHYCTQI